MKVRDHHRRDFACYARWRRETPGFVPHPVKRLPKGPTPTLEAFIRSENGETAMAPRHPLLLQAVMEGKRSLNAQIKDWAWMIADCFAFGVSGPWIADESLRELREDPTLSWLPDWVWKAVAKQSIKMAGLNVSTTFPTETVLYGYCTTGTPGPS